MPKYYFLLKFCLFGLLFNLVLPPLVAIGENDQPVYDLSTCIKSGLQNHPILLQSQLMTKYYQSGVDLAKSKLGPHISISGTALDFDNNKTITAFSTPGGIIVTKDTRGSIYGTGLTLSQPIFSSGSLLGILGFYAPSVEREKNNVAAQNFTNLQLRGVIVLDIIDTYGKILKTLHSLKIEEESLKTDKLLYETALSKYQLDLINKSELLDAESVLVNEQAKIIGLKSTLEINLGTLGNKVGGGVKISKISDNKAAFSSILCDGDKFLSLDELYELAYQKRNDIKALEAQIQSLTENLKVINSKIYPEVNLGAGYDYKGDLSDPGSNNSYGWNINIRLDIPLFDCGENKAEASQQESLIMFQREVLRALKNDIVSQIQENYQTIESLKETLKAQEKNVEKTKETLALNVARYEKGLVSELEVLKANDELAKYEQAVYEAEIDIIVRHVALSKAIGSDILACINFK